MKLSHFKLHLLTTYVLFLLSLCCTTISGQDNSGIRSNLPYFQDFVRAYPKHDTVTTVELWTKIGGDVKSLYENSDNQNSCAMRISRALNYSGVAIPQADRTFKGADGKNYYVAAEDLLKWMKLNFPVPAKEYKPTNKMRQDETVLEMIDNKQGIFVMIPFEPRTFGATGHADLFYKFKKDNRIVFDCDGGCYENAAYEIYFWELPKRLAIRQRRGHR